MYGLKAYYGAPGGRFHVLLYSSRDCTLRAMIEADHLGRMRTGAASGLATKLLANPEARTLGVIGAGRQAFTQVAAVCAVRKIETVRVFTRTAEHRETFAREIEKKLRVASKPVSSGGAAVGDADVVITITKSAEPVLRANWLKSGVHVNAAGANAASRREIDAETVLRATVRATDHLAQAQVEAGEYRDLVAAGRLKWQRRLGARRHPHRKSPRAPRARRHHFVQIARHRAGRHRVRRYDRPPRHRTRLRQANAVTCFPGAAQHAVVRCRPGIVASSNRANAEFVRPRTRVHRFTLHRIRERV